MLSHHMILLVMLDFDFVDKQIIMILFFQILIMYIMCKYINIKACFFLRNYDENKFLFKESYSVDFFSIFKQHFHLMHPEIFFYIYIQTGPS